MNGGRVWPHRSGDFRGERQQLRPRSVNRLRLNRPGMGVRKHRDRHQRISPIPRVCIRRGDSRAWLQPEFVHLIDAQGPEALDQEAAS